MAPNPPWADLPQELLTTIATFLSSDSLAFITFRSVCKSWNSSSLSSTYTLNLSPPLTLLVPPPPPSLLLRHSSFPYHALLTVTVVYSFLAPPQHPLFARAPTNWIAFVDQFNRAKVSLRLPFSRQSFDMPFNLPQNLNLLDFCPIELGRFYNLIEDYAQVYDQNEAKPVMWLGEAVKVVKLSNMSAAVTLSHQGKLGLLRLGLRDLMSRQPWDIIHDGKRFRFDDIVEFKGRVLGVDRRGRVYEIGLVKPFTINSIVPPIAGGGGRRKRLVESLGQLYLVVRCNTVVQSNYSRETVAFKVYQLLVNANKRKWVQVRDLGGMVFFFGLEFSFSASTQRLGGCYKENCIVFRYQSFRNFKGDNRDDDTVFSKLGLTDLYIGVCHLDDASHVGAIRSYPGYSGLLWPPPSWIWSSDKLKSLGEVDAAVDEIFDMLMSHRLKGTFEEEGNAATHEDLTERDQSALELSWEVPKLKIIVLVKNYSSNESD